MTLPARIAALVGGGDLVLPSDRSPGECEGSRFHSPTPMFVRAVPMVPKHWKPYPAVVRDLVLCGTCQDNYEFLCQAWHHYDGQLPQGVLREMGNQMRALVREAWACYRGGGS